MSTQNAENKEAIIKRLRRIEGQVKGIQKMVSEDIHCVDILTQISAVRAAINKVGNLMLEQHSMTCIENIITADDKEKALVELTKAVQSFTKFSE